MTVLFGLLAAIAYGVGDFAGAVASRQRQAVTILLFSYPIGAVLMTALLPFFPGHLNGRVVLFGLLGGIAGEIGVLIMYSLMAVAPINVISPVTAVLAAMVPVLIGIVLGERPGALAWAGIALGLVAVVLVSRTREDHPHGRVSAQVLTLATLSGLGFGFYFVLLARAGGHASGLWPLVISRVGSAALIVPVAAQRRAIAPLHGRLLGITVLAGVCDAGANFFFLLASRHGLLSVASVLTALYPAITVLLAMGLLREHATGTQRVGLGLAAASVVLITV
ncbi:MAG: DMT family transporter [Jatrophihabitans sp.]|uniref:DMT family transporter n=1 Tax=Jatrophihabitans sp. TaxID=1932789 RepID=UPI003F7E7214